MGCPSRSVVKSTSDPKGYPFRRWCVRLMMVHRCAYWACSIRFRTATAGAGSPCALVALSTPPATGERKRPERVALAGLDTPSISEVMDPLLASSSLRPSQRHCRNRLDWEALTVDFLDTSDARRLAEEGVEEEDVTAEEESEWHRTDRQEIAAGARLFSTGVTGTMWRDAVLSLSVAMCARRPKRRRMRRKTWNGSLTANS